MDTDDVDYGYEPLELFDVGLDGEIELVKPCSNLSSSAPYIKADKAPRPEKYQITMPSSMKHSEVHEGIFSEAAHLELRFRAGGDIAGLQPIAMAGTVIV